MAQTTMKGDTTVLKTRVCRNEKGQSCEKKISDHDFDEYEHLARIILSEYPLFGRSMFHDLYMSERPDLQSDVDDVGIEVTRILYPCYLARNPDGTPKKEIAYITLDELMKACNKYEWPPEVYMASIDLYDDDAAYNEAVHYVNAIPGNPDTSLKVNLLIDLSKQFDKKLEKLQGYRKFDTNALCIMLEPFDADRMRMEKLLRVFCDRNRLEHKFSTVYIISVWGVYGFDLLNKCTNFYNFENNKISTYCAKAYTEGGYY